MTNQRIECPIEAMEEWRQDTYSWISDASKDAVGHRVRYDISGMTNVELDELANYWQEQVVVAIREEAEYQTQCRAAFEKLVADTIASGAGDRKTAVRWLRDAEDADDMMYGDEWFTYKYNLGYNYDIEAGAEKVFEAIPLAA